MLVEKSSGAVVFRVVGKRRLYLLLSRRKLSQSGDENKIKGDVWDFPKGNIEPGEKPLEAAKREVYEETGLEGMDYLEGFKKTIRVFYQWQGEKRLKFITFFVARSSKEHVKISFEHNAFIWLPYAEAIKRLTFKNSKELIKEVDEFLHAQG